MFILNCETDAVAQAVKTVGLDVPNSAPGRMQLLITSRNELPLYPPKRPLDFDQYSGIFRNFAPVKAVISGTSTIRPDPLRGEDAVTGQSPVSTAPGPSRTVLQSLLVLPFRSTLRWRLASTARRSTGVLSWLQCGLLFP